VKILRNIQKNANVTLAKVFEIAKQRTFCTKATQIEKTSTVFCSDVQRIFWILFSSAAQRKILTVFCSAARAAKICHQTQLK
jgi:hypothetical protein